MADRINDKRLAVFTMVIIASSLTAIDAHTLLRQRHRASPDRFGDLVYCSGLDLHANDRARRADRVGPRMGMIGAPAVFAVAFHAAACLGDGTNACGSAMSFPPVMVWSWI